MRDLTWFSNSIEVKRTVVVVPGVGLRLDTPKSEAGTRTVPVFDPALMNRIQGSLL